MEILERPAGYHGPNLDPTGVRLLTRRLSTGVYALLADRKPCDNSGFVVGDRGVLVVDAGINGVMAKQIQHSVRRTTDKPILYLVNTNYHGDHTFGNYAFPSTTRIVASTQTRQGMSDLEAEKRIRSRNLYGNLAAIADVQEWRLPEIVFDDSYTADLGGRTVELRHFGPGNTPGDTVVYAPEAKAAWTGNLIGNDRLLPMLLEGGPGPYIDTLAKFKNTLDVRTIIPGHGPLGTAKAFDKMTEYLWDLLKRVDEAIALGLTCEAAVEVVRLRPEYRLPWWNPASKLNPLLVDMHRLNVLATYRALKGNGSWTKSGWIEPATSSART